MTLERRHIIKQRVLELLDVELGLWPLAYMSAYQLTVLAATVKIKKRPTVTHV
jgi:hypothetical protein